MTENWAYNLDMLAQNNVLDFDAPSYIKGQKARYVGNPDVIPPFVDGVPEAAKLKQPVNDEYTPPNKDIVKNPAWKKWLFGALAVAGVVVGGFALKNKLIPSLKNVGNKIDNFFSFSKVKQFCKDKTKAVGKFFKNIWNKMSFGKIKQFCVDKAKVVGNFFKKCWTKFKGLFTRKP